jgi:sulfur-oxidizing protein SoxZ
MASLSHVRIPPSAKAGEAIEVKTIFTHPMETGLRKEVDGSPIPRDIINRLECTYLGRTVFVAELQPAVSANPYITFFLKATTSGRLDFAWTGDDGSITRDHADLTVA